MADLVDPFGRTVRDLRISITDRCNFRCTYCMPEEGMQWLPRDELLHFEEIERLARVFVDRFDVDGIRLTGGEPTIRAHFPLLVAKLARRCGGPTAPSPTCRSPPTATPSAWWAASCGPPASTGSTSRWTRCGPSASSP
jgi:cyclic pyranopterin phosphate synthase